MKETAINLKETFNKACFRKSPPAQAAKHFAAHL